MEALTEDPVMFGSVCLTLCICAGCWLTSIVIKSDSVVDMGWSFLPVINAWYFAMHSNMHPRALLMAGLITLWGIRLTHNYWRKGGYNGVDDYRWLHIRRILNSKVLWFIFEAGFVYTFQIFLLMLVASPIVAAFSPGRPAFIIEYDVPAALCFLALLAGETVADQQQWDFQVRKAAAKRGGGAVTGDVKRGFLTEGLWSWSRHPNFFFEQAMWCNVYAFGCIGTGKLWHWTAVGPLLYILLFQGSTRFTEWISAGKYQAYKEYQKTTSMLIPFPPRKHRMKE